MRAIAALLVLAALVRPPAATAQRARHEVRFEVGAARLEQPGSRARNALILSALRHHADTVLAGLFAGTLTAARDSVAAGQLIGALAWRPTPASTWQFEGGASGSAFSLTEFASDANGSAWMRVRRQLTSRFGALVGTSAGYTARGSAEAHATSVDAGAWVTGGAFTVELAASRVRTEDSLLMAASRVFTARRSAWLDVADFAVTASWAHGPLDVSASHRVRRGMLGTPASQSATLAAATFAFTTHLSIVLSTGRQLADPLRGAPAATITMAMARLSLAELLGTAPPPRESDVTVARMTDGSVLIVRILAPAAKVEVAGSFSGWEPVPVTLRDGYWEAQIHVPPGRHRVAYRLNGGPWRAPQGLARLREFGGEVGLIVIP
jgi:hypothetical protein